ncbi:MAG: hypothetical protein QOH45_3027, partial [Pseudonocardiales bacterium]|nr:hypothetical protein [Pseudonocardiales bacterium]
MLDVVSTESRVSAGSAERPVASRRAIATMAFATGAVVANIYYVQPL